MSKSRIRTILVFAIGILLLLSATSLADVAKTTKNARMMESRGEKSRLLMRVPPGKTVKILAREGRWVKVRYKGRTGWVTRSSLTATTAARTTPKRKRPFVEGREKKRDFDGSGPSDRVGGDAVGGENDDGEESGDDEVADDEGDEADEAAEDDMDDEDDDEGDDDEGDDDDAARSKKTTSSSKKGGDDEDGDDINSAEESDTYESVVVLADRAKLHRSPSSRAKATHKVVQGAKLVVLKRTRSGRWMLVQNADGDEGWIQSGLVGAQMMEQPTMLIRTGARTGYSALTQNFASDGNPNTYPLAGYKVFSGAAAVSVDGDFFYRITPTITLSADVNYNGSYSSPGIHYDDGTQDSDTPYMVHEVNGGAAAGYNFGGPSGTTAYLRAGYHYSMFSIGNLALNANRAQLPSEIAQGLTVGTRLEIPRMSGDIGLRAGADVLLAGSRAQTAGLTDGNFASMFGAFASALMTYTLSPGFTVEGGYRLAFAKTNWQGAAQRPTGAVNQAARTDITHLVSVGVGKSF